MNEKADSLANEQAHLYAGGGGRRGSDRPQPPTREESSLSHVDETGRARMVDVGAKAETQRVAVARGSVAMKPETLRLIESNGFEKGDVLGVARIAGVMGAKSASQLIPLCHPLPLDQVTVDFRLDRDDSAAVITATAKTTAKTGVRDGGADRRVRRGADPLRHVQGRGPGDEDRGRPTGQQERRLRRRLHPGGVASVLVG